MKIRFSFLLFGILLFGGCDFDSPLETRNQIAIDHNILGTWTQLNAKGFVGRTPQQLSIFAFSETEYLVVYIANSSNEDDLYFRAYPIEVEGITCVQLQLLLDESPRETEDSKVHGHSAESDFSAEDEMEIDRYAVFSYAVANGKMTVKRLSSELLGDTDQTAAELQEAFRRHMKNPELFSSKTEYIR